MRRSVFGSKQTLGLWIGGALLACGLTACNDSAGSSSIELGAGSGLIADGTSALSADLASAPWQVAYHGVRRFDFLTESPAVSYKEAVSADGLGQFGLRVVEVFAPRADAAGFIAKQAQNEGFNYRYRGFHVLDPFLFEANYTVQLLNQEQVVAGVNCTRLLVHKRSDVDQPVPNHYLVDMDPESSLVLGWQELDSTGVLVSKMVFESFALGLAENPIPMGTGSLSGSESEIAIEDLGSLDAQFEILSPTLLPAEFRLYRAYEVLDASQSLWVRQVFTDGAGALIFMHKRQKSLIAGASPNSTMGVYEEGQWTILMGEVNGYSLLAVGKLGSNEIQDFVSSCF